MTIPYRLANAPGNLPDADKFMSNFDWLTAILFGDFLINGGQEAWAAGSAFTNPANATVVSDAFIWRKSGTSPATADVSRESTTKDAGTYSIKINVSGAGSADSILAIDQSIASALSLRSLSLAFGFKVYTATASKVRLKITDGTTTTYSTYHTGGGSWEHLQVLLTVAAGATSITVSVEVTSDFTGTVYLDSGYVYVIPPQMLTGGLAALAWNTFLANKFFPNGAVFPTPDGLHTWKIAIDNDGNITREQLT